MKVLTHSGFQNFEGIVCQGIKEVICVFFEDGSEIKCTTDHELFSDGEFIPACFLEVGDDVSGKIIIDICETCDEEVYDLFEVENTHSYTTNGVESHNCNMIYLDEFAFVQPNIQSEFFKSVYPTIISGTKTKVVITSTPNGFDLFYKLWTNAVEGRNDYTPFEINWYDVPGRDDEWRERTIANTSLQDFKQEFECSFIGSTNTLIDSDCLARMVFHEPLEIHKGGSLRFYKHPQAGHTYFCSVDTARGVGIDASAFVVFDVTEFPYEVVCVYQDANIDPTFYPDVIYGACSYYNNAYCLVEINDNGEQIANDLYNELEYENLIWTATKGRLGQVMGFGGSQSQRGVRTTKQVKRIGCSTIKTMIENNKLIVNDYNVFSELSSFVQVRTSYEAEVGKHDDLVMCLVLFAWSTQQNFFKELTESDLRKRLVEERRRSENDDSLPFGFIDDGLEDDGVVDMSHIMTGTGDNWLF